MGRFLLTVALTAGLGLAANPKVTEAQAKIKAGKFEEAITLLDSALKASPKNAEVRKGLADAHLAYADHYMYNDAMPPRMKYPAALREYRKVLEFDKENGKAKSGISTIEGIYKSMGRPIPQ